MEILFMLLLGYFVVWLAWNMIKFVFYAGWIIGIITAIVIICSMMCVYN